MPKMNKILVIVTNADEFEKVGFRTGLWLSELTHFCDVAQESGYQIDIASPSGGKIPIDPESLIISEIEQAVGMEGDVSKRYKDKTFMNLLDNTLKVSDVDPTYDAIYMTGGHGVMFDFPKSAALSVLIARFYESNKIVSAVCHGPSGLLEAKLSNGDYLIKDKNITGFSWSEEVMAKRIRRFRSVLKRNCKRGGQSTARHCCPLILTLWRMVFWLRDKIPEVPARLEKRSLPSSSKSRFPLHKGN